MLGDMNGRYRVAIGPRYPCRYGGIEDPDKRKSPMAHSCGVLLSFAGSGDRFWPIFRRHTKRELTSFRVALISEWESPWKVSKACRRILLGTRGLGFPMHASQSMV